MRSQVRFLRRKAVLDKVGFSATLLYNLEKAGDFPRHIMLTPRCAAWSEAEVDQWLLDRANKMKFHLAQRVGKNATSGA